MVKNYMTQEAAYISYDQEWDFLEVVWNTRPAYYTATEDERVMVLVDMEGKVPGLSTIIGKPFELELTPKVHKD